MNELRGLCTVISGTVASPSPFVIAGDIEIDGNTFNSVRNNGQGGLIRDSRAARTSISTITSSRPIPRSRLRSVCDWIPLGTIDEADLAQAQTDYTLSIFRTRHASNLTIRAIKSGR